MSSIHQYSSYISVAYLRFCEGRGFENEHQTCLVKIIVMRIGTLIIYIDISYSLSHFWVVVHNLIQILYVIN